MDRRTSAWNRGVQFTDEASGRPQSRSSDFYNRKAFAWNRDGVAEEKAAPKAAPAAECLGRIFEVVATTGTVRAEPHLQARLKGKKSRGGRVICSEVTMNGWLKLANEPAWLISHMQGVDGTAEVALAVDGTPNNLGGALELAVPEYQPQGMCCLEVVFKSGVPVRESPSKDARTLATRKPGELIFAHVQNFDGWVKLAGEEGWMLAQHREWGALLRPRPATGADLWALSDAWATARNLRSGTLAAKEVGELKELERRTLAATSSLFDQHSTENKMQELVETGLLLKEDLDRSEHWVFQRLFAGVLKQTVDEGQPWLKDLIPGFRLSPRVPPLWGAEDELQDGQEGWPVEEEEWGGVAGPDTDGGLDGDQFEGTTPVEFNGRTYIMAPNSVIFDPPNEIPIGIWNAETNRIDPAAGTVPGCPYHALSYFGRTYLLMPDNKLLDPETQKVVGSFNHSTRQMELEDDPQKAAAASEAAQASLHDPVFDDDEPVDPQEYLERGRQIEKAGRIKAAVALYSEALRGCGRQRSVDMDFECEVLRARGACYKQLGSYRELKEDADRLLGCDPEDAAAQEWRRLAGEGIRRAKFGLPDAADARGSDSSKAARPTMGAPQSKAPCEHCNGLATKCLKCGAGMERCAYCASPVSRANCCSKCHCTYYCGRDCQRAHWKTHKLECRSSEE